MSMSDLAKVAKAMVADGKGILAADESSATIEQAVREPWTSSRPRRTAAPTATTLLSARPTSRTSSAA